LGHKWKKKKGKALGKWGTDKRNGVATFIFNQVKKNQTGTLNNGRDRGGASSRTGTARTHKKLRFCAGTGKGQTRGGGGCVKPTRNAERAGSRLEGETT